MKRTKNVVAKTVKLTYHVVYNVGNKWIIEIYDDRGWKGSYYWHISKSAIVKVYKDLMRRRGAYVPKRVHLEVI